MGWQLKIDLNRLKADQKQAARGKLKQLKSKLNAEIKKSVTWQPLAVVEFQTASGETHEILADQSILVGGSLPGTTSYSVKGHSGLPRITAFRLEVLTHEALPGTGPGRGDVKRPNFILSEFQASMKKRGDKTGTPDSLLFVNTIADFSQKNWEIEKAIDLKIQAVTQTPEPQTIVPQEKDAFRYVNVLSLVPLKARP